MGPLRVMLLVLVLLGTLADPIAGKQAAQLSNHDKVPAAKPLFSFRGHQKPIRPLAFSVDGKRLVSSDGGGIGWPARDVITWDIASSKITTRIQGELQLNGYLLFASSELTRGVVWHSSGEVSVHDWSSDKAIYVLPD